MTSHKAIRALNAIDESPWTRNWNHLSPVHKGAWRPARHGFAPRAPQPVPVRDRIRQWNIVAGDRIRVRGDKTGGTQEVLGINRFRNLVFLKARQEAPSHTDGRPTPPSVRYSQCQLYIGDREFPPLQGETEPRVAPVFASRIRCSAPKYVVTLGRFDWERYAVQTVPRFGDRGEKIQIRIPWPKPPVPSIPPIDTYDTPADIVKEITWRPSVLFYPPSSQTKAKLLQDAYLHSIRPPPSSVPALEYDPTNTPAIEYTLGHELANPHSRAKKQRRARYRIMDRQLAHECFLQKELANLDGHTRKEALVEAEWKWREQCRNEERERKKSQWVSRGGAARLKRRRQRKERKQKKAVEKMRNLRLDPAPNQILPGALPASQM